MDVWSCSILISVMLGMFSFGFFLMTKLDKFFVENRRAIERESEKCEPSCVMLTNSLTDEEILEEIRRFRNRHKESHILIYDSSQTGCRKKWNTGF